MMDTIHYYRAENSGEYVSIKINGRARSNPSHHIYILIIKS